MIAEKIQFFDVERSLALQSRAWYMEHMGRAEGGMLMPGENHLVLRKCAEILEQVRHDVEKYGFDPSISVQYSFCTRQRDRSAEQEMENRRSIS
jgi:hypothetical protein